MVEEDLPMSDNENKHAPTKLNQAERLPAPTPSLIDVVLQSIAKETNFLGGGDEAKVYSVDGHDDWVVRVTDADAIASTRMLIEAYDIYDGRNLGQELYKGVGFTINRKQPGEGPQRIIQQMYEANKARGVSFPECTALLEYWQKMADLPQDLYTHMMLDMNAATKAGRTIDPNNCNYVVDFSSNAPKLGWVDIGGKDAHQSPNTIENVRYAILGSTTANLKPFKEVEAEWALESAAQNGHGEAQKLIELIDTAKKTITEKINQAGVNAGAPATYRDIEAYERAIGVKEAVLYDTHSRKLAPEAVCSVSRPANTLDKKSMILDTRRLEMGRTP
jgi:hypothetical protein